MIRSSSFIISCGAFPFLSCPSYAILTTNSKGRIFMSAFFKTMRRHFFTREFLLFLAVGCLNTFNGSLLAKIFELLVDTNLAFNIGYILANIIAYALNSRLIFHEPMTLEKCVKFAISYIPNYVIQNVIVFLFYNQLGFPSLAAFILAAVLGVPITFLAVKLFAFGRK